MDFIIEHFNVLFLILTVICAIIVSIVCMIKAGKEATLETMKEWLIYATTLAEKELGSGTGVLKLRYVYDMFLTKFPLFSKLISFETFSEFVDNALVDMRNILEVNSAIDKYVNK